MMTACSREEPYSHDEMNENGGNEMDRMDGAEGRGRLMDVKGACFETWDDVGK